MFDKVLIKNNYMKFCRIIFSIQGGILWMI